MLFFDARLYATMKAVEHTLFDKVHFLEAPAIKCGGSETLPAKLRAPFADRVLEHHRMSTLIFPNGAWLIQPLESAG